mmetsp:Transcript_6349/g.16231  ORF Transcript_6349/g.16231 Transcript_6349/m.16231 type:complete len:358 (-) Transcript_6349:22-1095(-)
MPPADACHSKSPKKRTSADASCASLRKIPFEMPIGAADVSKVCTALMGKYWICWPVAFCVSMVPVVKTSRHAPSSLASCVDASDASFFAASRIRRSSASSEPTTASPPTARVAAARLSTATARATSSSASAASAAAKSSVGPSLVLTLVSPRTSRDTRSMPSTYTVSNQPSPTGGSGSSTAPRRTTHEPNLKSMRRPEASLAAGAHVEPTRRQPSSKSTRFSSRPASSRTSCTTPTQGEPSRPRSCKKATSFSEVHSSCQRPSIVADGGERGRASIAASISPRSAPWATSWSSRLAAGGLRAAEPLSFSASAARGEKGLVTMDTVARPGARLTLAPRATGIAAAAGAASASTARAVA